MKSSLNQRAGMIVAALRIVVGGHLYISGMTKVINPSWSAQPFLEGSYSLFRWMAAQTVLMPVIDFANIWLLILAGAALVLGCCERIAALLAAGLLTLYYAAYPPWDILSSTGRYGPEFVANPLLIEIVALGIILAFPTGKVFGLQRWITIRRAGEKKIKEPVITDVSGKQRLRRDLLKSFTAVSFLGAFSFPFLQRRTYRKVDAISGATPMSTQTVIPGYQALKSLDLSGNETVQQHRADMPHGKIGNLVVSRLIADNGYLSGEFFARDAIHLQTLAERYHSPDRVWTTLKTMEAFGINTAILTLRNIIDYKLMDYFDTWGSRLQWIAEIKTSRIAKFKELVERNIKYGACAVVISREIADKKVANNDPDYLAQAIEIIKKYGVPAGIGAYYNETIDTVLKEKLQPDFILKSFHEDGYWSAHPRQSRTYMERYDTRSLDHNRYHDNLWCDRPEDFAALMKDVTIPWIAFQTSAGGAIEPYSGYGYALDHGASFVCSNLFDFQIDNCVESFIDYWQSR